MLFVIFINDIGSSVVRSLLKFADETKTMRQVPEVEYAFTLQEDLHYMYQWSQDWQLLFKFTSPAHWLQQPELRLFYGRCTFRIDTYGERHRSTHS